MADDLVSVKIPKGFFRNGTEYEASGRWYDGSLVRWENGRLRPIGGWRRVLAEGATLTGKARGIIGWRSNKGFRYAAIGTNEKLYISSGGDYSDLTPDDLVPGRPDAIEGPGYGVGPYGAELYGRQRTDNVLALDAATWSFDTWGENLVAVLSSDGRILEWSPIIGAEPAPIANAPDDCVGVLVTDEQHLLALGAGGDRRRVRWCSQSDNTEWSVSDLTTAGSRALKTPGNIVTGRIVGSLVLVWTTTDVHAMDYLGPPLIYNNRLLAESCGVISANAVTTESSRAFWMGLGGFYKYDGVVSPMPCEVQDYVFGDINTLQRSKIYAAKNSRYGEITWYYPSANSDENNRYVTFNYREGNIWYFGAMDRTCWLDRGVSTLPIAVDPSGVIFEHETGLLADEASRNGQVFIQSGPAEIGSGANVIYSNLMLPDVDNGEAIRLTMKTRTAPKGPETTCGPYGLVANAEGYVPVRVAGRQASLRIDQIQDAQWGFGNNRFKITQGGKR